MAFDAGPWAPSGASHRHVTIRNHFLDTPVVRCPINVNEPVKRQVARSLNLDPSWASELHVKHGGHMLDDDMTLADLGHAAGGDGEVSLLAERNPHDILKHLHVMRFHTPTAADVVRFKNWVGNLLHNNQHADVWHDASPGKSGDVCVEKHIRGNDSGLDMEPLVSCLHDAHMRGRNPSTDDFHGAYHSHADMLAHVLATAKRIGAIEGVRAEFGNLGKSFEGRDIPFVRLSKGPTSVAPAYPHGSASRPEILFTFGMHARERISPAVGMKLLDNIHDELKSNTSATQYNIGDILQNATMTFVPMINPDGYEYARTMDNTWRKTRTKHRGIPVKGVDPNRNFDARWGTHSSKNCRAEDFHGPSVESEPCVKHLANYLRRRTNIKGHIDWHSYGSYILFPYGFTQERAMDYQDQKRIYQNQGDAMLEAMKHSKGLKRIKPYTVGGVAETLYKCSGGVIDYVKDSKRAKYTACVELPGFGHGIEGFLAPPSQIRPVSKHAWVGAMSFAGQVVGEHNAETHNMAVRSLPSPTSDMRLYNAAQYGQQLPRGGQAVAVAAASTHQQAPMYAPPQGGVLATPAVGGLTGQKLAPGTHCAYAYQQNAGAQVPTGYAYQQNAGAQMPTGYAAQQAILACPGQNADAQMPTGYAAQNGRTPIPQQGYVVMHVPSANAAYLQSAPPITAVTAPNAAATKNAPEYQPGLLGGHSSAVPESQGGAEYGTVAYSDVPAMNDHRVAQGYKGYAEGNSGYQRTKLHDPLLDTFAQLPRRRVGISNLGNTCFMNSMMQCLASTSPLMMHCLKNQSTTHADNHGSGFFGGMFASDSAQSKKDHLVQEFSHVMSQLHHRNHGDTLNISNFKNSLARATDRFRGFKQEDSFEFLTVLRNALHESMHRERHRERHREVMTNTHGGGSQLLRVAGGVVPPASKAEAHNNLDTQSILSDIFRGRSKSVVTCSRCHHRSETEQPMWELAVDIPHNEHGTTDLRQCLQAYFAPDALTGSNKYHCESCNSKQNATKQMLVSQYPRVLAVVLKRFAGSNKGGFHARKDTTRVSYPTHMEGIGVPGQPKFQPGYDLYASSNHSGTLNSGHFVANVLVPQDRSWWHVSDSHWSPMFAREGAGFAPDRFTNPNAYVLFYRMRDTSQQ